MTASKSTICLNMIVKNEMANIKRCLDAVVDHISCWIIADTGSSDGTQDFIERFFAEKNIPGELHNIDFQNFSQSRNRSLELARSSNFSFEYVLFVDADMELIVEKKMR